MSSKLDAVMQAHNKKHGAGTIIKIKDGFKGDYDVIPSGIISIDSATGIGGFPKGRIVEMYGMESTGKSMLFDYIMAEAQKMNGNCVLVDLENSFDMNFAELLGVNKDELIVTQPDFSAEEVFQMIEDLIDTKEVDMIVVDSVSALVPKAEIENEYGASNMGVVARLLSQSMRKLTAKVKNSNCLLGFINQQRDRIGIMFGSPKTTSGGNALKFAASMRLEIKKGQAIKKGDTQIGNEMKIKFSKNKCGGTPFTEVTVRNIYGEGISKEDSLIEEAVKQNILDKKGAWYSYNGENISQGKDNLIEKLKEDRELYKDIYDKTYAMMISKKANVREILNAENMEEEKVEE